MIGFCQRRLVRLDGGAALPEGRMEVLSFSAAPAGLKALMDRVVADWNPR